MEKYKDTSWDFRTADTKTTTQCFHPYPAMMIPQVAHRLIDTYGKKGGILLDPFCGSGSSLVEAKIVGLNSIGIDINPLARLIAKVKTTPIDISILNNYFKELQDFITNKIVELGFNQIDVEIPSFFNIEFWFKPEVSKRLKIIKDAIDNINDKDIKDFFMVAFSETVREVSNTRNGEFKLLRLSKDKLEYYNPDVLPIFLNKVQRNIHGIEGFLKVCNKDVWVKILDEDTKEIKSIPQSSIDIVVTSPPYGDSKTTVAYGQFSRLSLQWIGFDGRVSQIDTDSLGGKIVPSLNHTLKSNSLNSTLDQISSIDQRRVREVLSFYIDLEECIREIAKVVKNNGYVCIVVGNRTVKGVQIPTDEIIVELFCQYNFIHERTIIRNIPNKRMPSLNSPTNIKGKVSSTMNNEYIVILKKGG